MYYTKVLLVMLHNEVYMSFRFNENDVTITFDALCSTNVDNMFLNITEYFWFNLIFVFLKCL